MAVGSLFIALQASHKDGRVIQDAEFFEPLKTDAADAVAEAISRNRRWGSALVVFPIVRLRDFGAMEEPTEAMNAHIKRVFQMVADFLNRRPTDVFESFRRFGLDVKLFVDVWMNQDQMEVEFPPELIAACGRQRLSMFVMSNDISAEEALRFGAT
jgi:hypothetical protein